MGPHPAVAAVRLGVRRGLAGLPPQALVLAACSGGADSLALAAALAFEAPRLGLRSGGVTVDHGLQSGSAAQAERVTTILARLGLDPVRDLKASVAARDAVSGYPGPEAAARTARYAALDAVADESGAAAILLGHTMDDQAETVLLGLARGSGARSLAGMAPRAGRYLRPLLGLRREQTRAACAALDLEPWDDPHNSDPAYTRVRVRERVLPLLECQLGPGVTEALARTADQLRADADALDDLVDPAAARLMREWPPAADARAPDAADSPNLTGADVRNLDVADDRTLDVAELAALPAAIRTRLLRRAAVAAGSPAGALTARHAADLDALVIGWHGQRWTDLPGGLRCQRRYGRLHFTAQA